MILDTSAIVSILNQEDDAARFAAAIEDAPGDDFTHTDVGSAL